MTGAEDVAMAAASCGHTFSTFGLFAQASLVVKGIIILLLICSFWSWTIIFAKLALVRRLKKHADKFEDAFWNCGSIDIFFDNVSNAQIDDPFLSVFVAGMREWRRAKSKVKTAIGEISFSDRLVRIMELNVGREMTCLGRHLEFLATVGSTAPFVGLFGTVWGIMNSFEAIGVSQNTSLAAVAPGIAEALFTTALGLVVTIPAVVAYNKISAELTRYRERLEAFVDEFSTIIARQMEEADE